MHESFSVYMGEDKKSLIALGSISLLLGITFNYLFFEELPGANIPIFILLAILGALALSRFYGKHLSTTDLVLVALSAFFASMVFIRGSELLTFFNVAGSVLLLFLATYTYTRKKLEALIPTDFLEFCLLPIKYLLSFFNTLGAFLNTLFEGVVGNSPKAKEVVRGSIIAVVLLVVFGFLFASADLVFKDLATRIFSFSFDEESVIRLIIIAIITTVFLGVFGYAFRSKAESQEVSERNRWLGGIETMVVFGAVNLLFLGFVALQFAYLFNGNALPGELTFAEYARRGFYELVLVAVLSYLLIAFAESQIKKQGALHLRSFKILSAILIAQVVIILVSAFMRLSLYEDAYGFSTIRLYSYAFMIWLGVILVFLSGYILANVRREHFTLVTFASVVVLLLSMNLLNPDAFIARENMARYAETGKIDSAHF